MTEKQLQFVREVGSVVLGVLIALGIGEAADALRWKFRVESSMESIRDELSGAHWNLVERLAYQDCLDKRLAGIGKILGAARHTGALPEVRMIGFPSMRPFNTTAFDVAKSEGAPPHMDRTEARDIERAYVTTDIFRKLEWEERGNWKKLQLLVGPGGAVSDSLLTAMLDAWVEAKENAQMMKIIAQQGDKLLVEVGAPVRYSEEAPSQAALVDRVLKKHEMCKPMVDGGVAPVTDPDPT